ncbi:MAG: A/G-specific adenine glycosylase [Pseudomonadota bacterium]
MEDGALDFAAALLEWFDRHGRKDLPWQIDPTPYRVWVSEIMLQQTQVGAVIPYYLRFMQRFPDARALADATLDEVLHLWTGLGYYARARNLRRSAVIVRDDYNGELPRDFAALQQLPGIGRSTAAAILALSGDQRHAILDGNVKRVLSRFHALDGWPGERRVEQKLWALAEAHTPAARVAHYTQAIMDLGATVCTRARPACHACPLARGCAAHAQGASGAYPAPKPPKTLPVRRSIFLMLRNARGEVLLEQRPPSGVWGGLWSFPEFPDTHDARALRRWCEEHLGYTVHDVAPRAPLRHSFSHFHLDITPVLARAVAARRVMEQRATVWYNTAQPDARGLAAPVKRLLEELSKEEQRA